MRLVQFAVPEKVGAVVAEAATVIAGGATLIPGALGWWVDGGGEIQRERVNWLIVGVKEDKIEELVGAVKSILRDSGESAIFCVIGNEPRLEWL